MTAKTKTQTAKSETPVLDFLREATKRELEFLAQHCHRLSGGALMELHTGYAFKALAQAEQQLISQRESPPDSEDWPF